MKERELLAEKRALEAEILERQEQIRAVEILLSRIRQQNSPTQFGTPTVIAVNGRRVRGTLKAAKQAVDALSGAFTRGQFFAKVEEINPALAGKIKPEAQRSTIRTLVEQGFLKTSEKVSEETGEVLYEQAFPLA